MLTKRTDLALEARELTRESLGKAQELPGVTAEEYLQDGVRVTHIRVHSSEGEKALGRPQGEYITLELSRLAHRPDADFEAVVGLVAEKLGSLLRLGPQDSVLVAGLGNEDVTPDAVGPMTADQTLVTAHLVDAHPEHFGAFRRVYVLRAEVLGKTGLESAAVVRAVCESLHPDCVLCVDALAAREPRRLCTTLQLTDTGIVPGSGVGNARAEISKNTLGIPVVCLGIPTVVDAATLAADISGCEVDANGPAADMIVSPREIDSRLRELTRLAAYGINCALHPGITVGDVDMLLG